MEEIEQLFAAPDVKTIINLKPLIVAPDTALKLAIAIMSQQQNALCTIDRANNTEFTPSNFNSSCVLIVEGNKLQGILT